MADFLTAGQQVALLDTIKSIAHSRRIFKRSAVAAWLKVSKASWYRWEAGHRMTKRIARDICRILKVDLRRLRGDTLLRPTDPIFVIASSIREAHQARDQILELSRLTSELHIWFAQHGLMGAQFVTFTPPSFKIVFAIQQGDDTAGEYWLEVFPGHESWTVLSRRLGLQQIPLLEGCLSEVLLYEIYRYLQIQVSRVVQTYAMKQRRTIRHLSHGK